MSTLHTSECESGVAEYLAVEQQNDPRVRELKEFLEQGTLPTDPARARKIALQQMLFAVIDGVVYFIDPK